MEREHQEILSNLRTQLGRVILGKPDVIVRAEYSSNGISIDPFYAEMGGQNLVPLEEYSQAAHDVLPAIRPAERAINPSPPTDRMSITSVLKRLVG